MTDIVERLRELEQVEHELAHDCDYPPEATANWKYAETCREAAAEIERLRAALEEAKTALAPLATRFLYPDDIGADYAADLRSDDEWDEAANEAALDDVWIARGDIRRARAALEGRT